MSTRALTHFFEEDGSEIVAMYTHCDGYPSGHGKKLAEFLVQAAPGANGAACLAASAVARFKDGPYQTYLYPAGTKDAGQEYDYYVHPTGPRSYSLTVTEVRTRGPKVLFKGNPSDFQG